MLDNLGEFAIRTAVVIGIACVCLILTLAVAVFWIRKLGGPVMRGTNIRPADSPVAGPLVSNAVLHGVKLMDDDHGIEARRLTGVGDNASTQCESGLHLCGRCGARVLHNGLGLHGEDHRCTVSQHSNVTDPTAS